MNITDDELADEFATFNITIDKPDIIDRVKELCMSYRMSADSIVIEWVAYAHTHRSCALSIEALDQMERERLSKKGSKVAKTPKTKKVSSKKIYDINSLEQAVAESDDILGAYSTPTGKTPNKRQHTTPENPVNKRLTDVGRSPAVPFSPSSLSPASATPSKKYSSRSNAGEVIFSMGDAGSVAWKAQHLEPCSISAHDPENTLTDKFKYMFQKLSDKAIVLNEMIEELGGSLQQLHNIEEFSHVAMPAQKPVTVVGRILCDSVGKINAKSVVLEASRETSAGRRIPVDLSEVKQYSLFPGQIVAMDGINNSGTKFVAKKVYDGVSLPPATKCPAVRDGGLRVVVACGPFTTTDSLMYEPLADLIKALQKEPPDVCIMLGPFVDVKNPEIEKGKLNATFEDFFRRTIEQISSAIQRLPTQLVIVPSQRDIHHDSVYPQPPFSMPKLENQNVHFVSDPCVLSIEGVVFGITSTDILFHLGTEEISYPPASSDRLARLAKHILTQHNFYPLYPSSEEVNVDFDHYDVYARLHTKPHVLLLPSDLRYFAKEVDGCCCVNPGRLSKGQVGGTYARLYVPQPLENKPLAAQMAAQIVRI